MAVLMIPYKNKRVINIFGKSKELMNQVYV